MTLGHDVVHVQPNFVKGLQALGYMPLLESGSGPLEAHNALCGCGCLPT